MRITEQHLRQIIKEELRNSLSESSGSMQDPWTADEEAADTMALRLGSAIEDILPEIVFAVEGPGTDEDALLDAIKLIQIGQQLDIIDAELKQTKGQSFRDFVFEDLISPIREHETIRTIIKHLNSLPDGKWTWSYDPNYPRFERDKNNNAQPVLGNPVSQKPKY